MSRSIHVYTIPQPGQPLPGWVAPPMPANYDPDENGAWDPKPPTYRGPDPWDGQDPQFRTMGIIALNGAEEDSVIQQSVGLDGAALTRKLAVRSLAQVDGRKVKRGELEPEMFWKTCPPMIRDLWLAAYNQHNVVQEVTAAMFLSSAQRTEAGD